MRRSLSRIQRTLFLVVAGGVALSWLASGTVSVWVDDAHTRKINVPELDPDEIADTFSLSLGLGVSHGDFGISFGWARQKGIEYDESVQKLIEQLRELCEEFNEGELSLESYQRRGVVLKHEFVGGSSAGGPRGEDRLGWDSNFFYGARSAGWRTFVPNYGEVLYPGLWDGIDMRYYPARGGLKYDVIVGPGADPSLVRLRYAGATALEISPDGSLLVETAAGIGPGLVVSRGTADNQVTLGGDATGIGITVRSIAKETESDGSVLFAQKEAVGVNRNGTMWVTLAGTGSPGAAIYYIDATGALGIGTAAAGQTQIPNAELETTVASTGTLGKIRFNFDGAVA